MSDQPLGTPTPEPATTAEPSIVDTILDLDELLSADVRRAEKTARFCLRPDLEARLDELEAELGELTDSAGQPLTAVEGALGDDNGGRTAQVVAMEMREIRAEMARAFRSVRLRQMPDDDWQAFLTRHRVALEKGAPYPAEMWNDLIVLTAVAPTISPAQVVAMRKVLGRPAMDELGSKAFKVNTEAGVSIPKSWLSSAVLKPQERARS